MSAQTPPTQPPSRPLLFDACHLGLVLRAVLFTELVAAVAALFVARDPSEWLLQWSIYTVAVLPATLAWLVVACHFKAQLQDWPAAAQYGAGTALGALCGLIGAAIYSLIQLEPSTPWLACAASGALLGAMLLTALVLRARGQAPAATTARLAELQSRIRPHFLFNALNSAIALVRDEPGKAEALLEDLSDLFRHALSEPGESVTLAEEIALAGRYLEIEKVRFGDRLKVFWALDQNASNARLPPLLLQPLVENAVKHGIEPSAHGGQLFISTERQGARVHIRIHNSLPPAKAAHDNASPQRKTRGKGMALNNVRARLALLHDIVGEFSAGELNGQFEVHVTVPIEGP